MRPALIYPQLPHLHNHGLAISSHAFEKNFRRLFFSSNMIKIREPSKRWSIEKKREKVLKKRETKRKKKEKKEKEAPRVSSNEKGKSIF
jgi:hypothetical protein